MKKDNIACLNRRVGFFLATGFINGNYVRVATPLDSVIGSQGVAEFYLTVVTPDQRPVLLDVQ